MAVVAQLVDKLEPHLNIIVDRNVFDKTKNIEKREMDER